MRGYDQYNTLLLPPLNPGDKLPQELLDWDEEESKKLRKAHMIHTTQQGDAAAGEAADDNAKGEQHSIPGIYRGVIGEWFNSSIRHKRSIYLKQKMAVVEVCCISSSKHTI